jgi:hypothetical protein
MLRTLKPSSGAEAAVLAVVQRAQEQLPDRDAPLADRLFALECAARGGRAVAATVERYRGVLREAAWWLEDNWELDVPHAVVVAQALSAADALEQEPPHNWPGLLAEAVSALEQRQTRYGLGGDPALLAAVLRGLAATAANPPDWLLAAASDALDRRGSAEAVAELAEALGRHRSAKQLAPRAISAVFTGAESSDQDAAYARWWLAGRRGDVDQHMNVRAVEDSRLQALTAADPSDAKAAAMVMEAAARAAGQLVITTPESLNVERGRQQRQVLISRAAYRGAFFAVILIAVLLNLHHIAHALAPSATDEHTYRQCVAGVACAGLGFCISGSTNAIARALGKDPPEWSRYLEVSATVIAGIVGAVAA